MPPTLFLPSHLLLIVCGITLGALMVSKLKYRRLERELSGLAKEWQMHYSSRDVFKLAARVAPQLPLPGAADVRVSHLIYGNEDQGHRYIFCTEYTAGAVRSKVRRLCVISAMEPRGKRDQPVWLSFKIAPTDRPIVEQYKVLK